MTKKTKIKHVETAFVLIVFFSIIAILSQDVSAQEAEPVQPPRCEFYTDVEAPNGGTVYVYSKTTLVQEDGTETICISEHTETYDKPQERRAHKAWPRYVGDPYSRKSGAPSLLGFGRHPSSPN